MKQKSSLQLAVGHLNASVGSVLTPEQLAAALRSGSAHNSTTSPAAAALISSLFAELSPDLILQCAAEAAADIHHVNHLYREALADALPPVRVWEASVEHFI